MAKNWRSKRNSLSILRDALSIYNKRNGAGSRVKSQRFLPAAEPCVYEDYESCPTYLRGQASLVVTRLRQGERNESTGIA
jgi:hypothetical protein